MGGAARDLPLGQWRRPPVNAPAANGSNAKAGADSSLLEATVALADDALVLGHRLSEWCGKAPFLEEDLAMANTALDFLGRARLLYGCAESLGGRSEDQYAYLRDAPEFTNLLICELPGADFAAACARQFLVDAFDDLYFPQLAASADSGLADIARKAAKEAAYHRRHSSQWVLQLGDGTEDSHARMQAALDNVWGYHWELFDNSPAERPLIAAGVLPDRQALREPWREAVAATVAQATLRLPASRWRVDGGRAGIHTEHLGFMLAEMQHLPRTYPGARW